MGFSVWMICICTLNVATCIAQSPCDHRLPVKYKGTLPAMYFDIDEISDEDLHSTNKQVRLEIPLHGRFGDDYSLSVDGYNFVSPMEYFNTILDPANGKSYFSLRKGIDRDENALYSVMSFVLTCSPTNSTYENKTYDVMIVINDVNDNTPTIVQPDDVVISEATLPSTVISRVEAQDKDSNQENGLTFSLLSRNNHFEINNLTGEIRLKTALDFDTMGGSTTWTLPVMVEDGGPEPIRSATTSLLVTVTDADDQGPAFVYTGCIEDRKRCVSPGYSTSVDTKKNSALVFNTFQGRQAIVAHDLDLNISSEIKFSIVSTIPLGYHKEFKVDTSMTGEKGLYQAKIVALKDKQYPDGFQIVLKAEEQTINKYLAITRITFKSNSSPDSSGAVTGDKSTPEIKRYDDDSISDLELGLVAAVSVLATLTLCLGVSMFCVIARQKAQSKSVDFTMTPTS